MRFDQAHFIGPEELCDRNHALADALDARAAWRSFAQSVAVVDWGMSPTASLSFAVRFSGLFISSAIQIPDDLRSPSVTIRIALMRDLQTRKLIALVQDHLGRMAKAEIQPTADPKRWDALIALVREAAPKVRVEIEDDPALRR